jgi:putative peptide zinc metalloprotease protein
VAAVTGQESADDAVAPRPDVPRLAEGVQLIGEYEGSGFKEPPSLVRRADGQVVQLSPLLYQVADLADGHNDYAAIGEQVGREIKRQVSADNVRVLVEDKLRPLGILAEADGSSPEAKKLDPLLALKFRAAVIPEGASKAVAAVFKPLFLPPVVLAAVVGLGLVDAWLFLEHGIAQGLRETLYQPGMILLVFGVVVLSAAFHEVGHAAACSYGGGEPGKMGCGLYLAWPAFYTDVTDAYRLGRLARLRTDLGGVYFNMIVILAITGVYALTGFEALLLIVVFQHAEIVHQLLPLVRLDGYYIVADLTGVPDLFSRIKPILASLVPGRDPDERVRELKTWARMVVTVWVFVVIPLLVFQLGMLLLHAPRIFATAWDSLGKQWDAVSQGFAEGDLLAGVAGTLQTLILVVPLVGVLFTFARLGRRMGRAGWRQTEGKPALRAGFLVTSVGALALLAWVWLPNGDYEPIRKGERGTLGEALAAVTEIPSGRPGLVVQERAAQRGELAPPDGDEGQVPPPTTAAPTTTAPTTSTTTTRRSTTTTTRARTTSTTATTSATRRSTPTTGATG